MNGHCGFFSQTIILSHPFPCSATVDSTYLYLPTKSLHHLHPTGVEVDATATATAAAVAAADSACRDLAGVGHAAAVAVAAFVAADADGAFVAAAAFDVAFAVAGGGHATETVVAADDCYFWSQTFARQYYD